VDGREAQVNQPRTAQNLALALVGIGLFILGLVVLIFVLPQAGASGQTGGYPAAVPVTVDYPAPQVGLTDLQGNPVSLAALQGRWVLVNHWATWCPPCKAEMPDLVKYYEAHKQQNFALVGIESGEPEAAVKDFVEEYRLTYLVWPDPEQRALKAFKEEYLPSSYLIDPQGQVRLVWNGPVNLDTLEQHITPQLEE